MYRLQRQSRLVQARGGVTQLSRRTFVDERALQKRMANVQNVSKITAAMRMVASARFQQTERSLMNARPFGAWIENINSERVKVDEDTGSGFTADPYKGENLFVIFSTDKGLCGGVNSVIARETRKLLKFLDESGVHYKLVLAGNKISDAIPRTHPHVVLHEFRDHSQATTFHQASLVAEGLAKFNFDHVTFVYNHFKSMMAYEVSLLHLNNPLHYLKTNVPDDKENDLYNPMTDDFEYGQFHLNPRPMEETARNFFEFQLASACFRAMTETAACEISQRMNAMEGATKNAEELFEGLQLLYNRARQARITTELTEITGGKVAMEDEEKRAAEEG
jgi:F-type H+-transporting ATPase subunit gamma